METPTETRMTYAPAPRMSLWAIDEELQFLMEKAQLEEEETGAISPETSEALRVYFSAALVKVDSIAGFLKLEKVIEPAYKAEKRRLEERWRSYENSFARCKNLMMEFLKFRELTKIKGATNTISRQANSQASLHIEDASKIPSKFRRMNLTVKLDSWNRFMKEYRESPSEFIQSIPDSVIELFRSLTYIDPSSHVDEAEVRKALQAGEEVEGAELKFGEHIRVR